MSTQAPVGWEQLAFEQRQAGWGGFRRRFVQPHGRNETPRIWEAWVVGDRFHSCFYQQGSTAIQETSYLGKTKNKGRANEVSPEQDALAEGRREVRKKHTFEGYDELLGNYNIDQRHQGLSVARLTTSLPGSFCVYKPEHDLYDCKKLLALARDGKAWYTIKRDGEALLATIDAYGNVHLYSRRGRPYHKDEGPEETESGLLDGSTAIPWAARFPHLIAAIQGLRLPPSSLCAFELIAHPERDDPRYIGSLMRSLTPLAIEKMQQHGLPLLYWWGLVFYGGQDTSSWPMGQVVHSIHQIWRDADPAVKPWVLPIVAVEWPSPEHALAEAKKANQEGWVVVDPSAALDDKTWNLKGKPDRPKALAKLKIWKEDDFVVLWDPDNKVGSYGTGRHEPGRAVEASDGGVIIHGGVGALALYQYDRRGDLIYVCDCASGLDYETQAKMRKEHFPQVWRVSYQSRSYTSDGDKTNALRLPSFVMQRNDKTARECTDEKL